MAHVDISKCDRCGAMIEGRSGDAVEIESPFGKEQQTTRVLMRANMDLCNECFRGVVSSGAWSKVKSATRGA